MTNINILTIHKEPNYGAILQALALYKKIEQLGYKPNLINLSMKYRRYPYNLIYRILIELKNKIKGYSYCFDIAERFSNQYCPNQIGNFHSMNELKNHNWNTKDYYIIGSDQVWNPAITQKLKDVFCLSFLGPNYKYKFSYAPSFGNIKNEEALKTNLDLKSIATFTKLSVREKFGVDFLAKNGIKSVEVIDPTLLLDDYSFLLKDEPIQNNNLLFLSLSDMSEMNEFVHSIADKYHLSIEKHFGYLQPTRKNNRRFLPVEDWLYHIASSKLIVTDSFHATVFAILFKKPFYVYISEPAKVHRISNLLNKLNINGRIVKSIDEVDMDEPIDFADVSQRLTKYRENSIEYLKSILEEK